MRWKDLLRPRRAVGTAPPQPKPVGVPAEYLSLHKYLERRYADMVVLTFGQIEDLLGFALPAGARLQREWWANAGADGRPPSGHARAWTQASRTATPNFQARTVTFERA